MSGMHQLHHILELVFACVFIALGAYRYFFAAKSFPGGDVVKIQKMKIVGFILAMIGVALLAMNFLENF